MVCWRCGKKATVYVPMLYKAGGFAVYRVWLCKECYDYYKRNGYYIGEANPKI